MNLAHPAIAIAIWALAGGLVFAGALACALTVITLLQHAATGRG